MIEKSDSRSLENGERNPEKSQGGSWNPSLSFTSVY